MQRLFQWIIRHQASVLVGFAVLLLLALFMAQGVGVNYNLMSYLPEDAQAILGLQKMKAAYHQEVPSIRVMVPLDELETAEQLAERLEAVEGVTDVAWLGDVVSTSEPLEYQDPKAIADYYRAPNFLYTLTINPDLQQQLVPQLQAIADAAVDSDVAGNAQVASPSPAATKPHAALSGNTIATVYAMTNTEAEVQRIQFFVVLIVLAILLATTSSWFEPILFMVTIGVAIAINRGTNLLFGEISFVTNAAATVLQLAVSMDYAIFLLHRFADFRQEGHDVQTAMLKALDKSFGPILASAGTTIFGFAALMLMRYRIGYDLGIVLGKSVIFSLLCVLVLLPVLTIRFSRWIDKTHHRPLTLKFRPLTLIVTRLRVPALLLFIAIAAIGFLAQGQNHYQYGISGIYSDPNLQINRDRAAIDAVFGSTNQMVLLLPGAKGDGNAPGDTTSGAQGANLHALTAALKEMPQVSRVVSFAEVAGTTLPEGFVPEKEKAALIAGGYERMLITTNVPTEGDEAFATTNQIKAIVEAHIDGPYYLIGETPSTQDLKGIVTADNTIVNLVAIGAIGLILVLTFKSITMPLLLLGVIEGAIFINLSVPYITDQPIFYIGYLIIGAVQLGATVDYAILFGSRYLENRQHQRNQGHQTYSPTESTVATERAVATETALATIRDTGLSILTSASIMAVSGYLLGGMSSNQVIAQLGTLVGRGAIISALLVLTVLPCALCLIDQKGGLKTK